MSETLVRHLRIGICDDKCRAMEARSGCLCAEAADTIEQMLAALKFVHEHITDKERGPRDLYPAFGLNSSRAIEMVSAAISKATGATS